MDYPLVVGNWKMNLEFGEAMILGGQVSRNSEFIKHIEIVIAPPSVFIYPIFERLKIKPNNFHLALQNISSEINGEFTGEVSPAMIKKVCDYTIIGHSERRRLFHETDEEVNLKVNNALKFGLKIIVCIGEAEKFHLEDHYQVEVKRMLKLGGIVSQAKLALKGVGKSDYPKVSIAYEPLWAIGTGNASTGSYAAAIAYILRNELVAEFGPDAKGIRILYGGSVNVGNAKEFVLQPNIDGLLVGGASLKIKDFTEICRITSELKSGMPTED